MLSIQGHSSPRTLETVNCRAVLASLPHWFQQWPCGLWQRPSPQCRPSTPLGNLFLWQPVQRRSGRNWRERKWWKDCWWPNCEILPLLPGGRHGAFCPFSFFGLCVLTPAQHTDVCSVHPGLRGWLKPTSGLTFMGEVTFCLLSIRVFLLLSIVGMGFGKPRRRKMGKWDSLFSTTCVSILITTGVNMARNPLLSVSTMILYDWNLHQASTVC